MKSLEIMQTEPEIFERLQKNVAYIQKGYEAIGLPTIPSQTPIISIFVGDEGKTFQLIKEFFEHGVFATPVLFPAVPYGQAMIRTSYMASHTQEDLDHILDVMRELAPKYGILKSQTEMPEELTARGNTWNFDAILNAQGA